MTILNLFLEFVNIILDFEIFGIKLFNILIGFTLMIFTFKVIKIFGNVDISSKKNKGSGKE